MRRGRGGARTEHHFPSVSVAAVTDQSNLPKDDGGWSPRKVPGRDGLDRSNNNDRRLQMGGGTTPTALQSWKAMHVSGGGTGMTIKLDCVAIQQQLQ